MIRNFRFEPPALAHRTLLLPWTQRIFRESKPQQDRSSDNLVRLEETRSELRFSGLQVHAAEKIGEARVGAQGIVDWVHFNVCIGFRDY